MNADTFKGKWGQFKGELKRKWGKFTDDDFNKSQTVYVDAQTGLAKINK